MKRLLKTGRIVLLSICASCVFALLQCAKNEFSDDEYSPVAPLFDFSSVTFIARITENSADWSLCMMDASGKNMRKLVDMTVSCQKPVRSNSGDKLLFTAFDFNSWNDENNTWHATSQYELYIVNVDGTGLTLIDRIDISESDMFGSVAWSPDDKKIIYVRNSYYTDGKTHLILYNISDDTRTIIPTEGNVCIPSFSPDGKQIAYCTTVETNDITDVGSNDNHHIYKMDADGSNNQLMIKNAASPKWSPKGDKIMYTISGKDRSSQIAVANADGSNQQQLTSSVSPEWWDSGFPRDGNSDPQWTANGSKIVYVSYENKKPEIFIMNVDGGKKTRLSKAEYRDNSPEVTPDGEFILFNSKRPDMDDIGIAVMTVNGSSQKMLSNVGAFPIACR